MGSNNSLMRSAQSVYDNLFRDMFGCTFDDLFRVPSLDLLDGKNSYFYSEESHTDSDGKTVTKVNDNGDVRVYEDHSVKPHNRAVPLVAKSRLPSTVLEGTAFPPTNVYVSKDKDLVIECAVAGLKEDEYGLKLKDQVLIIEFDPKESEEEKAWLQRGIKPGVGSRRIYIDHAKWDASSLEHKLENGMLTIRVPKQPTYIGNKVFKSLKKDGE